MNSPIPLLLLTAATAATATTAVTAVVRPQNSFHEVSQRGSTRIFYWGAKGAEPTGGSIGQVCIDYGQPAWKDEYDAAVDAKRDYRWRLGQNFWTRIDSNIDLTIGGVDVPAGNRYLALEHTSDDRWLLWAIDPQEAYEHHLDAYHAHFTTGGLAIPMEYERVDAKVDVLKLTLRRDANERDLAALEIRFGPHRLVTEVAMHPAPEESEGG